ncbi:hypothetical protein PENSPDRAFT_728027 [Peniophora sp. CONT]|nr:hypothetical protein PENSPDRAFT_728027 [Peniophora sp. CONT]
MRALSHVYIRSGVDRYKMDVAVYAIVFLVHFSVVLFTVGLIVFLVPVNSVVAWLTGAALVIFGLIYLVASIIPLFENSCPYRSPLTHMLASVCWLILRGLSSSVWLCIRIVRWVSQLFVAILIRVQYLEWYTARRLYKGISKFGGHLKFAVVYPTYTSRRAYLQQYPRLVTGISNSASHFESIWVYTSRQMLINPDNNALRELLQATFGILESIAVVDTRLKCIEYLSRDMRLARRLYDCNVVRGQLGSTQADLELRVASTKMLCLLLQRRYTAKNMRRVEGDAVNDKVAIDIEKPTSITGYHLASLFFLIGHSQNTDCNEAKFARLARIFLFQLRWFLLAEERKSTTIQVGVISPATTCYQNFFADKCGAALAETKDRDWWPLLTLDKCDTLDGPGALLLLLNSWQYNAVDSTPGRRQIDRHWMVEDTGSCLVPVHDGACCKNRDELLEDLIWKYGKLWPQRESLCDITKYIRRSGERRVPSAEFRRILCDTGLEEWLDPLNDRYELPPPSSAHGSLFAHRISFGSMLTFGDALRTITRSVDFTSDNPVKVEAVGHTDFKLPLAGPSTITRATVIEQELARTIESVDSMCEADEQSYKPGLEEVGTEVKGKGKATEETSHRPL